jgi:ATP/maltotriose-dependent transcriptional regulator MalT
MFAQHWRAAAADYRRAIKLARHAPSYVLPRAHLGLGQALFYLGDWDEAIVHGRVAVSLLSDERTTWQEVAAHGALVEMLAARGDWDSAREQQAACQRLAPATGSMQGIGYSLTMQASVAAAAGQHDRVVELLLPRLAPDYENLNKTDSFRWYGQLITALIGTGALDLAAAQIDALAAAAAARPTDMEAELITLRDRLHARQPPRSPGRCRGKWRTSPTSPWPCCATTTAGSWWPAATAKTGSRSSCRPGPCWPASARPRT